jgi:hypothetical protein
MRIQKTKAHTDLTDPTATDWFIEFWSLFVKVIIKIDLPGVGASVRDPGHAFTQQAAVLLLVLSNKVKHGL